MPRTSRTLWPTNAADFDQCKCTLSPTLKRRTSPRDMPRFRNQHTNTSAMNINDAMSKASPLHTDASVWNILKNALQIAPAALHNGDELLQSWAISFLDQILRVPNGVIQSVDWRIYTRCIAIFRIYGRPDLTRRICAIWERRMYLRDPFTSPLAAIRFAESCNLTELRPHAYYAYLIQSMSDSDTCPETDEALTPSQNVHLRCGYHSLRTSWKALVSTPPSFTCRDSCNNHDRCAAIWKRAWEIAVSQKFSQSSVDILFRLDRVKRDLVVDPDLQAFMSEGCRVNAFRAVKQVQDRVFLHLGHHFDLGDDDLLDGYC